MACLTSKLRGQLQETCSVIHFPLVVYHSHESKTYTATFEPNARKIQSLHLGDFLSMSFMLCWLEQYYFVQVFCSSISDESFSKASGCYKHEMTSLPRILLFPA